MLVWTFNPMSHAFIPVLHILFVHRPPELLRYFVKQIRCSVHCYACQRFLLPPLVGSGRKGGLVALHRPVFIDYEIRVKSEVTDLLYYLDHRFACS